MRLDPIDGRIRLADGRDGAQGRAGNARIKKPVIDMLPIHRDIALRWLAIKQKTLENFALMH